jgi:hypothetical protein
VALGVLVALVAAVVLSAYVYDLRWKRKVEAKLAEFRAAGQPVTWAEVLAARRMPPDAENSALVMLKAFERMQRPEGVVEEELVDRFPVGTCDGRRRSDRTRELVRAYLAKNAEALTQIHGAEGLPGGAYPLDATQRPWELLFPHLSGLRRAESLCSVSAVYAAEGGDRVAAVRDLMAGRTVAESLGEPVCLIDALVRMAANELWAGALEGVLGLAELTPQQLGALRQRVEQEKGSSPMVQAWHGERAFGLQALAHLEEMIGGEGMGAAVAFYRLVPSWHERDALFYADTMGRMVQIASLPLRERVRRSQELAHDVEADADRTRLEHLVSSILMPAFCRAVAEEVKMQAQLEVARVGLALEEWRLAHRAWPDSLEELVPGVLVAVPEDPFSDRKVRYLRTPEGVVVYSVGLDGKDDRGVSEEEADRRWDRDVDSEPTWDISFRLLDPERRGVGQTTFAEDAKAAELALEDLEDAGYTREELERLGFTQRDFAATGRVP